MTAFLLAACGGKDGTPTAATPDAPVAPAQSTPVDAAKPVVQSVGKTGWWGGFDITVKSATLTGGRQLAIDVTYKNTNPTTATLGINHSLQVGNQIVDAYFDTPEVPAGGTAAGTITTTLGKASASPQQLLDSMSVVFGTATDNQTIIPLRATTPVDSVQPRTLGVSGHLNQELVQIDVLHGSIAPS